MLAQKARVFPGNLLAVLFERELRFARLAAYIDRDDPVSRNVGCCRSGLVRNDE